MSIESTPPPAPLPANPVTPAKNSHLLLKVLGAIVLLFILKSMFFSKSTTTPGDASSTASIAGSDGNPLIGSWTIAPDQDPNFCAEKVSFTSKEYFATLKGVQSGGATAYSVQPTFVIAQTTNIQHADQFNLTSPTSITKAFCSSMSCTYCLYNKD
jgi:hypothetical protein